MVPGSRPIMSVEGVDKVRRWRTAKPNSSEGGTRFSTSLVAAQKNGTSDRENRRECQPERLEHLNRGQSRMNFLRDEFGIRSSLRYSTRGDFSDDDGDNEPLDEVADHSYDEPPRRAEPLKLFRDFGDPGTWENLIDDERLRSWLTIRKKHRAVLESDMEALLEKISWMEVLGGTGKPTRKTAWLVDGSCKCQYRYGKEEVEPRQMEPWFKVMMRRWLEDTCDLTFLPNSVNLNLYDHGAHAVTWHADDEALFEGRYKDCSIVSVSLGETRRFRAALRMGRKGTRMIPDRRRMCEVDLAHGDVCAMEGLFQKHYIHQLSRCAKQRVGPRINATFRWITRHAKECPLRDAVAADSAVERPALPSPVAPASTGSHFSSHDKNFLATVKRIRAILKLEEQRERAPLDKLQEQKFQTKGMLLQEVVFLEQYLLGDSGLREKHKDILNLAHEFVE